MRILPLLFLFLAACQAPAARKAAVPLAPAAPRTTPDLSGMALIPGGNFFRGAPGESGRAEERPGRQIFLDPYYIDKYEVSLASYNAFTGATGREVKRQACAATEGCPVVYVDWNDAQAYCHFQAKRLPTEAEWEKAARGGSGAAYCFGDDPAGLGEYAWFWDNSGRKLHPSGKKKPNAYGVYDMHGNVLEWVADWYSATYYSENHASNPAGPLSGDEKVIRGGSAYSTADMCRSFQRMKSSPHTPYSGKGFRCAANTQAAR